MQVGVIGASGYVGNELLKLLLNCQGIEIKVLNSETYKNQAVKSLCPDFPDSSLRFTSYSIEEINRLGLDLVFLSVPPGRAKELAPQLDSKIIDLSADFRLPHTMVFKKLEWHRHKGKNYKDWVYGLPELFREKIKRANYVANPGCYATACILAGLPLVKGKLFSGAVFDCKSGYSGAGREKTTAPGYMEKLTDNILAYNITQHRHMLEIQRFLGKKVGFTPHVMPTFRGIMCTGHFFMKKKLSPEAIRKKFEKFYAKEPFVKISDGLANLHEVQNTNLCIIGGFEMDPNKRLVVLSVLDNLLKGAAGQAVQNMNLMLGLPETNGLG